MNEFIRKITRLNCSKFLIHLSIILFPLATVAQDGIFADLPYEPEFIREKLKEHTVQSNKDQRSKVPDSIYYEIIFKELLFDPDLTTILSEADWEIIKELPSHSDDQFTSVNLANLEKICDSLDASNGTNIASIAARFSSDRKRSEDALTGHYNKILLQLSQNTLAYIENRYLELSESQQVGYSALDMGAFALDLPEVALKLMKNGCVSTREQMSNYTPRSLKMIDEKAVVTALETIKDQ